jgi:hypothetical protein
LITQYRTKKIVTTKSFILRDYELSEKERKENEIGKAKEMTFDPFFMQTH